MSGQRTVRKPASIVGVGLHSGKETSLTLRPAPVNSGIVFRRTDLPDPVSIRVSPEKVTETMLATTLSQGNVKIGTIEHLMSALNGFGIDNVYVDVDGPEVPIMDGSGYDFVGLIDKAGLSDKPNADKWFVRILEPVEVKEEGKFARLEPYEGFALEFTIDFDNPVIARSVQHAQVDLCFQTYRQAVSYARTFGFLKDAELLKRMGLGRGGSLENAIIIDGDKVLNPEGLRADDEFVKHKILDAMGDLYVLGRPLLAKYVGYRSGHALNNSLIRMITEGKVRYELVKFGEGSRCRPRHYDEERLIP